MYDAEVEGATNAPVDARRFSDALSASAALHES